MNHVAQQKKSFFQTFLHLLRKPGTTCSAFFLLLIGAFTGILLLVGFNAAVDATNTLEFCTGCHEMREMVYTEYRDTIHYSNRTGIRVTCADCHVPRSTPYKLLRKAKATFELWGHFTGSIDTREKFEAMRMQMATNEWERMKASGSRECRSCHDFADMRAKKQGPRAQKKHAKAQQEGKTCIDCHKGVAHLLPAEYVDPEE
jgi:cytochrome c-type protein NapC